MKIITKKEAQQAGIQRYFTGKPCLKGHIAERYVSSNYCIVCARITVQKFKETLPKDRRKRGQRLYIS